MTYTLSATTETIYSTVYNNDNCGVLKSEDQVPLLVFHCSLNQKIQRNTLTTCSQLAGLMKLPPDLPQL